MTNTIHLRTNLKKQNSLRRLKYFTKKLHKDRTNYIDTKKISPVPFNLITREVRNFILLTETWKKKK